MMNMRSSASLVVEGLRSVKQNVEIRRQLRHQTIGLVALDVVGLGLIEQSFGRQMCDRILVTLKKLMTQLDKELSVKILAIKNVGDDFSVFVKLPMGTGGLSPERFLYEEACKIKAGLERRIADTGQFPCTIQLYMGSSLIRPTPDAGFQVALYNAIKDANHRAKHVDLEEQASLQEFHHLMKNRNIETFFQPIFSFATGERYAVEALLRGPVNSSFRAPDRLFGFAQTVNELTRLDRLSVESSIATFGNTRLGGKLFINVDSRTLMDPEFTFDDVFVLLEQASLRPHEVVIEVTERNWVGNYTAFNEILDPYRRAGFCIAVDDAGMGYSSLQAITELKPEYIKVDKSLIRHIDHEMVKSAMLETLVDFARKVNSTVIAEGIETDQELQRLMQLGIDYGQGFLLAKPAPPSSFDGAQGTLEIILRQRTVDTIPAVETVTVSKFTREVQTFDEDTRVSDVAHFFQRHEDQTSVVIVRGNRPVGLVMRDKLLMNLATQYGVPLYWHRPITKLMDPSPLVVESAMPLEVASRLSVEREQHKVYDAIIVTHMGELLGVITIQDILSTLNTIQLERARGSNPLTGLPGNRSIKREIRSWIQSSKDFVIIYADIDHFKWFNDCYGFHRGDQVIQFLADILTEVRQKVGTDDFFVGHVGGDDFIVITDSPSAQAWCDEVIDLFDTRVVEFYRDELTSNAPGGGIDVIDREGNHVQTNGLSLSLSLLQCPQNVTELALEDIVKKVVDLKKMAKERTGSTCIASSLSAAH